MLSVIILAAGKGTRMKSEKPKVLFHTAGKPMIDYTVELSKSLNPEKIVVVTGNMAEAVQEHICTAKTAAWNSRCCYGSYKPNR